MGAPLRSSAPTASNAARGATGGSPPPAVAVAWRTARSTLIGSSTEPSSAGAAAVTRPRRSAPRSGRSRASS
eukprot:scaffold128570_cov12-Tisochrysis_lutea.AAC.1